MLSFSENVRIYLVVPSNVFTCLGARIILMNNPPFQTGLDLMDLHRHLYKVPVYGGLKGAGLLMGASRPQPSLATLHEEMHAGNQGR